MAVSYHHTPEYAVILAEEALNVAVAHIQERLHPAPLGEPREFFNGTRMGADIRAILRAFIAVEQRLAAREEEAR